MLKGELVNSVVELYKRVATSISKDVEDALRDARAREKKGSTACNVLDTILTNIKIAREKKVPVCQDTGTHVLYVNYPTSFKQADIEHAILEAARVATKDVPLRPNAVNPITGENSGDNTGKNFPIIHFSQWDEDYLEINLMLKGGGSENIGQIYKLPNRELDAGRDLNGVKKCVLDAVFKAQANGCPPYIVGVGLGSTMDSTLELAKKQLFRHLDDKNPDPTLSILEEETTKRSNELGIGPTGLGGKTTVLATKVDYNHRAPASFFVGVCFSCWANRRGKLVIKGDKTEYD